MFQAISEWWDERKERKRAKSQASSSSSTAFQPLSSHDSAPASVADSSSSVARRASAPEASPAPLAAAPPAAAQPAATAASSSDRPAPSVLYAEQVMRDHELALMLQAMEDAADSAQVASPDSRRRPSSRGSTSSTSRSPVAPIMVSPSRHQRSASMPARPAAPKGLQPSDIAALPVFQYQERHATTAHSENKQCTICLSDFEVGDMVRLLPCMHRYHRACIDSWLLRTDECCVCKTPTRPLQ